MMNVTFRPKHMTAWELQEEFMRSSRTFYDIRSSFQIMARFGPAYGLRRLGLAAAAKLGTFAEGVAAELGRGSYYYSLKHGETGTDGAQKAEGL